MNFFYVLDEPSRLGIYENIITFPAIYDMKIPTYANLNVEYNPINNVKPLKNLFFNFPIIVDSGRSMFHFI